VPHLRSNGDLPAAVKTHKCAKQAGQEVVYRWLPGGQPRAQALSVQPLRPLVAGGLQPHQQHHFDGMEVGHPATEARWQWLRWLTQKAFH
jgi:hypothetical protein